MLNEKFNSKFLIKDRMVGEGSCVFIVAEAGVSHFGSEEKALKLVDLALEAGADAVKFQIFDVNYMISSVSNEWKERMGSRQLDYKVFDRIQAYCFEKGIIFFATAHDEPSLEYIKGLDVPLYKIGSGEVGNWQFIEKIAKLGKPLIFSTGMYKQKQIEDVLEVISSTGNKNIAVLHCVTDYPAAPCDIALGNMVHIRDKYKVITGYSDHTSGFHIPLAAVALGATIIEKHITLEYNIPNAQDWKVSCGPDNFRHFVSQVRDIEASMTTRLNGLTANELNSFLWASKSLVANREISIGDVIDKEDLCAKRPGNGISPSRINEVIGRIALIKIPKDKILDFRDLS